MTEATGPTAAATTATAATIPFAALDRLWDCIVIGAGPAGALAARQVAQLLPGLTDSARLKTSERVNVLLVDKSAFPRSKVCGCCINGSAQNALAAAGLPNLLKDNQALPLHKLILFDLDQNATIDLPGSYSLSRGRFDAALVDSAIAQGVHFLPETLAIVLRQTPASQPDQETLTECRRPLKLDPTITEDQNSLPAIRLESRDGTLVVRTKVVIVADGLAGRALERYNEFNPTLERNSRFGAGVILDDGPGYFQRGHIYMAFGNGGYAGLVRLEDDRIDVAAAFDQDYSRDLNGPALAAAKLLTDCKLPVPPLLSGSRWTGTQPLTRKRTKIATERLFVIGDACGYPEPFTGEGIAWALWSALYASRLAAIGVHNWHSDLVDEWSRIHHRLTRQQKRSSLIAQVLRNDSVRQVLIRTLSTCPALVSPVVQHISCSIRPSTK